MRSLAQFLIIAVLLVAACQPDQKKDPLSPEEVLKIYQAHFDKNEFNEAMGYSTEAGINWIQDIAPMIRGEFGEETIMNTVFHKIDCKIVLDTANCQCLLEDDTETYEAFYRLIKVNEEWLVDAPDEEHSIEYEDREEIFEEDFNQDN